MAATSLNHYLLGLSRLVLDVAAGVCVACSCLGRAIIKCCGLRGAGSSTGGVAGVRLAGAFIMCHGMRGAGISAGGVDVCLAGATITRCGLQGAGSSTGGVAGVCLAGALSQVWGAVSCQQVVAQMGLSTGTKGRSWERRLRLFCNAEGKMGREFLRCW